MAKELPYFKFEPNQWENGNIQYFNRNIKGLFIDLCSMYWSRLGELDHALALQKLCGGNTTELDLLCDKEIFIIENGKIVIEFLDEQLSEFQETSVKRAKAANKRWSDANEMQVHSNSNAIREDKIIEDKIIEEKRKEKNIDMDTPNLSAFKELMNNETKDVILVFDGVVKIKDSEFDKLCKDYQFKEIMDKIYSLSTGIHNKDKKYTSKVDHYRTILTWLKRDKKPQQQYPKPRIAL
jgi:hypothetical protein